MVFVYLYICCDIEFCIRGRLVFYRYDFSLLILWFYFCILMFYFWVFEVWRVILRVACVYYLLAACVDGEFQCANGHCIPEKRRCDKINHCQDGSDEKNCSGCRYFFIFIFYPIKKMYMNSRLGFFWAKIPFFFSKSCVKMEKFEKYCCQADCRQKLSCFVSLIAFVKAVKRFFAVKILMFKSQFSDS